MNYETQLIKSDQKPNTKLSAQVKTIKQTRNYRENTKNATRNAANTGKLDCLAEALATLSPPPPPPLPEPEPSEPPWSSGTLQQSELEMSF